MSSLLVFVFSVLIFHTGATTLSGAYVPVSRGNPMPTSGDNVPGYDPLYLQAKRTLLGFINKASKSSSLNPDQPACSENCIGNAYKPDLNLQEKQALLRFIKQVRHSGYWDKYQRACSWEGVTCSPGGTTVLYLRLPQKNLTGEIPSDTIGYLTSLRVLSLDHNGLSGEIPSDFSKLNFLTTLYLDHNNFSGNISSFFSTLSYLTILRLDNNNFSGNLPYLSNGQDLTTFNVSYNKLVGPIPPSLSKFPLSAFTNNIYLCGRPTAITCETSYRLQPLPPPKRENTPKRRAIFGLFSGSTMLLLIFLGSAGKNMYQYIRPTSKNKQLVTFGDDVFDLEDMLKTTVEVLGGGSVGTSYKQVLVGENKTVLKILKDVVVTEEEFKAKMDVLGKIKNRYVVPLRAYYNYSSDEKWLVYDYMPAGSLSPRLHGNY